MLRTTICLLLLAAIGCSAPADHGTVHTTSCMTDAGPCLASMPQDSEDAGASAPAATPREPADAGVLACRDVSSDRSNCGSCGHACSARSAVVSCEDSRCIRVCELGSADCNHDLDAGSNGDGCETVSANGNCGPDPSACEPDTSDLRDDVVYLCNCEADDGSQRSEMAYYSRFSCARRLPAPEDFAVVPPGTSAAQWEGMSVRAVFGTKIFFESHITKSAGTDGYRGTGANDFTEFNCYQGAGQELYHRDKWTCLDVYYCRPVSAAR